MVTPGVVGMGNYGNVRGCRKGRFLGTSEVSVTGVDYLDVPLVQRRGMEFRLYDVGWSTIRVSVGDPFIKLLT